MLNEVLLEFLLLAYNYSFQVPKEIIQLLLNYKCPSGLISQKFVTGVYTKFTKAHVNVVLGSRQYYHCLNGFQINP